MCNTISFSAAMLNALIVAASALAQGTTHRPSELRGRFEQEYMASLPQRMDRYIYNRQAAFTVTYYDIRHQTEKSQLIPYHIASIVTRSNRDWIRSEKTARSVPPGVDTKTARVFSVDELYDLKWNTTTNNYSIKDFSTDRDKIKEQEWDEARMQSGLAIPLSWKSVHTVLYDLGLLGGMQRVSFTEVDSIQPVMWRGRALTRVVFRASAKLIKTGSPFEDRILHAYFDPSNAWICYGMEAEPLSVDKADELSKYINWVDYVDGPDGYPIPKRYTQSVRMKKDSKEVIIHRIEFSEYARFYPSDSEVNLESFGLTRPAAVQAALRSRYKWVWYAADAAAVLLVAAAAVYIRKRRQAKQLTQHAVTA